MTTPRLFFNLILFTLFLTLQSKAQGLEWVYTAGGAESDGPEDMVVDLSGNVVAVGFFLETVDFNVGGTPENRTSNGSYDCFITKHNAAGELLWCKTLGSSSFDICTGVDIDSDNNIYVIGRYNDVMDVDPGDSVYEIETLHENGAWFILKLNSDGEFVHCISIDGSADHYFSSIAINEFDDFIISGTFNDLVDFDPSFATFSLWTEPFASSLFIASYTSAGEFQWAKQIEATGVLTSNGIHVDNSNNVHLIGQYNGTVDFDPSESTHIRTVGFGIVNGYIVKFDEEGNFDWMKQLNGTASNWYYGLTNDEGGNVYLSGGFEGVADFNPGPALLTYESTSFSNHFVQKLSSTGNLIWAKVFNEENGFSIAETVSVDSDGNSYIGGYFDGDVDFNSGLEAKIITSIGSFSDGFVQKLDPNGDLIWARAIGGEGFDSVHETFQSLDNSVVVFGRFQDAVNFNPDGIVENRTSVGGDDVFLIKLSNGFSNLENESLVNLSVYPNPFNSIITLSGDLSLIESVCVFSLDGKVVYTQDGGLNNLMLDFSPLATGTYILELRTDLGMVRSQITKN